VTVGELLTAVQLALGGGHPDKIVIFDHGTVFQRWGRVGDVTSRVEGLHLQRTVVPGKRVVDFLKGRDAEAEVSVEHSGEHTITLRTGRNSIVVPVIDQGPLTEIPAWEDTPPSLVWRDELNLRHLVSVAFAASKDWDRPLLTGVVVTAEGCHATDSYRAAYLDLPTDWTADPIQIPAEALQLAAKHLDPDKARIGFQVEGRVRYAVIEDETHSVITRLIEGNAPDARYFTRMETTGQCYVTVDRKALLEALRRVKGIEPCAVMWIAADGGAVLRITAEDAAGKISEAIPIEALEGEGGYYVVGFLPEMLIDAIEHHEGDFVVIETTGPDKPIWLRGIVHQFIMPVRVTTKGAS